MVQSVDEQDVIISLFEIPDELQAGKSGSDDDDPGLGQGKGVLWNSGQRKDLIRH